MKFKTDVPNTLKKISEFFSFTIDLAHQNTTTNLERARPLSLILSSSNIQQIKTSYRGRPTWEKSLTFSEKYQINSTYNKNHKQENRLNIG